MTDDNKSQPLLGLELIRFGCTLPVLLWHYQHFYYVGIKAVDFERPIQPLFWLLRPLYLYGHLAVQVFWCLSGFIFYWKYAHPIRDREITARRFAWLRFSRLYPLHLVTLFVVAALAAAYKTTQGESFVYPFQDGKHFIFQLLMASNWASTKDFSYNGPIWSVSVEILVYIIFFTLCRAHITRPAMMLGLMLVAQWATEKPLVDNFIVFCVFMFYIGALTAYLYRWLTQRPELIGAAQATCMFLVAWITRRVALHIIGPAAFVEQLMPPLMILMIFAVKPRSRRVTRCIGELGNLTYASYLWHFPVQLAVALWFVHHPQSTIPVAEPWFLVAFVATTYAIAFAGYHLIELPAQRWLRSVRLRARRADDVDARASVRPAVAVAP